MDLTHVLILIGAGLVGGTLSAVIGGASLLTFPALLATGLPPVNAAACNLTALVPCNFFAAIADRTQLPPLNRSFGALVFGSVVGAGIGAALLLSTPQRIFAGLIPLLLGFATILFAYAGRITTWLRERRKRLAGKEPQLGVTNLRILLPVSVYGGYFGAGVGVLLLAVLSIGTGGDYRSANVTKNLVTSLNSMVAAAIMIAQGAVYWPQTLAMMSGAVAGGLIGSWLARVLPRQIIRFLIIAVGLLLTIYFAHLYWF